VSSEEKEEEEAAVAQGSRFTTLPHILEKILEFETFIVDSELFTHNPNLQTLNPQPFALHHKL